MRARHSDTGVPESEPDGGCRGDRQALEAIHAQLGDACVEPAPHRAAGRLRVEQARRQLLHLIEEHLRHRLLVLLHGVGVPAGVAVAIDRLKDAGEDIKIRRERHQHLTRRPVQSAPDVHGPVVAVQIHIAVDARAEGDQVRDGHTTGRPALGQGAVQLLTPTAILSATTDSAPHLLMARGRG